MAKKLLQKVRVSEIRQETARIAAIRLEHATRPHLQPCEAGSHVTVALPGGTRRQYSLCGDPADAGGYWLGVLAENESRGGSRAMHALSPGDPLFVTYPANSFPLLPDPRHVVLLAGGIGITPIVSMVHELHRDGRSFELHYCGSRRDRMAFLDTLEDLVPGGAMHLHISGGPDATGRLDLAALLRGMPPDAHLFACGPDRLLADLRDAQESSEDLAARIHVEQFSALPPGEREGDPFEIEIAGTSEVMQVGASETALQILRDHGYVVPSSCEGGICGECAVDLEAGDPIHRDRALDEGERASAFITCMSRANGRVRLRLPPQPRTKVFNNT